MLSMGAKVAAAPRFAHCKLEQLVGLGVELSKEVKLLLRAVEGCYVARRIPSCRSQVEISPELVPSIRLIRFGFSSDIDELAIEMLKCAQGLGGSGEVSLPVLIRP
jgi:hypothetical protein